MWYKFNKKNHQYPTTTNKYFCGCMLFISGLWCLLMDDSAFLRALYFPMQQDMNFPKLFLHTISIIDYQWVTMAICRSCDKIGLSVTNSVTKLSLRIASDVTRSSISLVEGKKRLCCSPRKCVTIRWFFHPWKPVFYLETFQFHLLFPTLISEHFTIYFYHFGQVFSLIGISNTWTRPDKHLIFFLQPEYFLYTQ